MVSDQANVGAISSREELEKMARRRLQRGSVQLRGKRKQKWVGRWREDAVTKQGQLIRINRKAVLGTKTDFPTKKLALRELELRIAPINSVNYRALSTATFAATMSPTESTTGRQASRPPLIAGDCSGGCKWFHTLSGRVSLDWGVCGNPASHRAGLLTFEHQGCSKFERK
jgi:hypothetical protein